MVRDMRVINQVDAKYLICQCSDRYIVALDQHAVDERIKLEKLQSEVFTVGSLQAISLERLSSPVSVDLSPLESQLLSMYRGHVEYWGWSCSNISSDRISLHSAPMVLGVSLSEPRHLLNFLAALDLNGGSAFTKPPCILRVLNSKACRSAIMFGDVLTIQQSSDLLENLKSCRTPFQCAHGRPSISPLVDLDSFSTPPQRRLNLDKVTDLVRSSPSPPTKFQRR